MHRIIQNPALPVPPGLTALLLTISLALPACAREPASAPVAGDSTGVYTLTDASPDGIGKVYLGREISFVMGHPGADWLERPTREAEERTDLLLDNLPLAADDVVADGNAGRSAAPAFAGIFAHRGGEPVFEVGIEAVLRLARLQVEEAQDQRAGKAEQRR